MNAFESAKKIREQSGKFVAVTGYILSRYGKLVTSYEEVQDFFTEMYLKKRPVGTGQLELAQAVPTIPVRPLSQVFPGIEKTNVHRVARYDSLLANYYKPTTDYLLSPRELLDLCAMVAHLKPGSVFEFGTHKGATTANLALNAPKGAVIQTIDNDPKRLDSPEIRKVLEAHGVERIFADSLLYDFSALQGNVDFVFVDGAHEHPVIDADCESALQIAGAGSTTVWHDYGPQHPHVVECLAELSKQISLVNIEGTSLVVHRK